MNIKVVREDGRIETLILKSSVTTVTHGPVLNRLSNAFEIEHFFTKDGYYDGWGTPVECSAVSCSCIVNDGVLVLRDRDCRREHG